VSASKIFVVPSQRGADRAGSFVRSPLRSLLARHRVSARRLARPKSAKRSGRRRQAQRLQAGGKDSAKLLYAGLRYQDFRWLTPSTTPMTAAPGGVFIRRRLVGINSPAGRRRRSHVACRLADLHLSPSPSEGEQQLGVPREDISWTYCAPLSSGSVTFDPQRPAGQPKGQPGCLRRDLWYS
jgi:hypothetical protein